MTASPPCKGVGIHSEIGRHLDEEKWPGLSSILYISSVDEANDFALKFHAQIMEVEEKYILPATNIENTIAGFMKKIYYFWPGHTDSFVEHLVSYGLLTSDFERIDYAFRKIAEVLSKPQINDHSKLRDADFTKTVIERLAEQYPELPSLSEHYEKMVVIEENARQIIAAQAGEGAEATEIQGIWASKKVNYLVPGGKKGAPTGPIQTVKVTVDPSTGKIPSRSGFDQ